MTTHEIIIGSSNDMSSIPEHSVQLIVTSPPYPMIGMWDKMFCEQNPEIESDLNMGNGISAFEKMHDILNRVWNECDRVLIDNGFMCINIGDATRTVNGEFALYPNHSQVISHFLKMGYCVLPDIHWRKPSNSPNKFMGSGMYPAGAYVTYEHEYILIFRKGGKRVFKGKEKLLRQKSAFFWEERNVWFSDLWEIKGTSQMISAPKSSRDHSAAFPIEIPFRLVNMYSAEGDTVLDPFFGLGTTSLACMIANRNSIGVEIDEEMAELAMTNLNRNANELNPMIDNRLQKHLFFIDSLPKEKREKCYQNRPHGFPVKTKQETEIEIERLSEIEQNGRSFICRYKKAES